MFLVLCDRVRRKWKGFFFAKRVGRNRLPHPYHPKSLYTAVEDGQRALVWLGGIQTFSLYCPEQFGTLLRKFQHIVDP